MNEIANENIQNGYEGKISSPLENIDSAISAGYKREDTPDLIDAVMASGKVGFNKAIYKWNYFQNWRDKEKEIDKVEDKYLAPFDARSLYEQGFTSEQIEEKRKEYEATLEERKLKLEEEKRKIEAKFDYSKTERGRELIKQAAFNKQIRDAYLAHIESPTGQVAAGLVTGLAEGIGDYTEIVKGAAISALIGGGLAITGFTGGAGAGAGAGATAAAFALNTAAGMVDNYITSQIETEIGIENYTKEESLQNAIVGGLFQVGIHGVGIGAKKLYNKAFKTYEPSAANIVKNAVENPSDVGNNVKVDLKRVGDFIDEYGMDLPENSTQTIERVIFPSVDEQGNVKYNVTLDTETPRVDLSSVGEEIPVPKMEVSEFDPNYVTIKDAKFKNQNIEIEIPKEITRQYSDSANRIATLNTVNEAKMSTIYSFDEFQNRVPLTGGDKIDAYFQNTIGNSTSVAGFKATMRKAQEFGLRYEDLKTKARLDDITGEAAKEVVPKLSLGDINTIKTTINNTILAPLETARKQSEVEFFSNLSLATKNFNNYFEAVEKVPNGDLARYFVQRPEMDGGVLDGFKTFTKDYSELYDFTFSAEKNKEMQIHSSGIRDAFPEIFSLDKDDNTILSENFIKAFGNTQDDALINININKDLSLSDKSLLRRYGISDPNTVDDILSLVADEEVLNASAIKSLINREDLTPELKNSLSEAGLYKNVDGVDKVSQKDFIQAVSNLAERVADGDQRAKDAYNMLFNKESSRFIRYDENMKPVEKLSLMEVVFNGRNNEGTSYFQARKTVQPIQKLIYSSINDMNKKISKYEATQGFKTAVFDFERGQALTKDILGEFVPRAYVSQGKDIKVGLDKFFEKYPQQAERTLRSSKFGYKVEKLRELNNKYNFVEDSVFEDLNVENLVNREKYIYGKIEKQKNTAIAKAKNVEKNIDNVSKTFIDEKRARIKELKETQKNTKTRKIEIENRFISEINDNYDKRISKVKQYFNRASRQLAKLEEGTGKYKAKLKEVQSSAAHLSDLERNKEKYLWEEIKEVVKPRSKKVWDVIKKENADMDLEIEKLNSDISEVISNKKYLKQKSSELINGLRESKDSVRYATNNKALKGLNDAVTNASKKLGINYSDIELKDLTKSISELSQFKKEKNMSAKDALAKVKDNLLLIQEKARDFNQSSLNKKRNDIAKVKEEYLKTIDTMKKVSNKRGFTEVYGSLKVQDQINKLVEMGRKVGIFTDSDKVVPIQLMDYHDSLLSMYKDNMQKGRILNKGEKVSKYKRNMISTDSAEMARLGAVINKDMVLSDKAMFNMAKDGIEPDYKIQKAINELDENLDLTYLDVGYKDVINPKFQEQFEKLYQIAKPLFAEVLDEGAMEARDLNINEFAAFYWQFLQDLSDTRYLTSEFELGKRKPLSALVPFFKSKEDMFNFFLFDDIEKGRTGFVKNNNEMIRLAQGLSEKGAEYNALGMSLGNVVSIVSNRIGPVTKEALSELRQIEGRDPINTASKIFLDTAKDLIQTVATPKRNPEMKFFDGMSNFLYKSILWGGGLKELSQTELTLGMRKARILGGDTTNPGYITTNVLKNLPRAIARTPATSTYFYMNTANFVKGLTSLVYKKSDLNNYLLKFPELNSKRKYVLKLLDKQIQTHNSQRHLQLAEFKNRVHNPNARVIDRIKALNEGFQQLTTDQAYYCQYDPELLRGLGSHEIAYETIENMLRSDSIENVSSQYLKNIIKDMGTSEEFFSEMKNVLGKYVDGDGAINLDFTDIVELKKQLGNSVNPQIPIKLKAIYDAALYKADKLNKAQPFEKTGGTVAEKIARFLKNTTTGIAAEDLFDAVYKMDNAGFYVKRIANAFENKQYGEGLKDIGDIAALTTSYFPMVSLTNFVGYGLQNLLRNPLVVKRQIAEAWGRIKEEDEEGNIDAFGTISNLALSAYIDGLANAPFQGAYLSGGNAFADKSTQAYRRFKKALNETSESDPTIRKWLEATGISSEKADTIGIYTESSFKTILSIFGVDKPYKGWIDAYKYTQKSSLEKEYIYRNELKKIKNKIKEPTKRKQAMETYIKLTNEWQDMVNMVNGAMAEGFLSGLFERGEITEKDVDKHMSDVYELTNFKQNVEDKLREKDKKNIEGIAKISGATTDVQKKNITRSYVSLAAEGLEDDHIISVMTGGNNRGVEIATQGEKALSQPEKEAMDNMTKNYDVDKNIILDKFAKDQDMSKIQNEIEEKAKPKTKEAKEKRKEQDDYKEIYNANAQTLNMLNNLTGERLFTQGYLAEHGIATPVNELTDSEKMQILRKDYYDPIKNLSKNKEDLNKLFMLSVALGSDYVEAVFTKNGKNINKTIDYIYDARYKEMDNGDYKYFFDTIKHNDLTDKTKHYHDIVMAPVYPDGYVPNDYEDDPTERYLKPVYPEDPKQFKHFSELDKPISIPEEDMEKDLPFFDENGNVSINMGDLNPMIEDIEKEEMDNGENFESKYKWGEPRISRQTVEPDENKGPDGSNAKEPDLKVLNNIDSKLEGEKDMNKFIEEVEGKAITKGYVPDSKNSNSGVTIATGVDLGSKGQDFLDKLSPELANKLKPYVGLKKEKAVEKLKEKPLIISNKEAEELDDIVYENVKKSLIKEFDKVSKTKFEDLPKEAQDVLLSITYQYGSMKNKTPKAWQYAINGEWDKLVDELNDFGDNYKTRRKKEADRLSTILA